MLIKKTNTKLAWMVLGVLCLSFLIWPVVGVGSTTPETPEVTAPVPMVEQPMDKPVVQCDYLLKNGTIVDGSGSVPYIGDVAIAGDEIAAVGQFEAQAACEIDATGMYISPGFIDLHTHSDNYWPQKGNGAMILKQGLTTLIVGNCGTSTSNIRAYLKSVEGAAVNVGTFAGYKSLRSAAGVTGTRKASTAQITKMAEVLQEKIRVGAFGFSVGLDYSPQTSATTEELITLASAVQSSGCLFAMHIRSENDKVVEALQEAIAVAKKSGVKFEYSHIKSAGQRNWDKMPALLDMVSKARTEGVDICADVYGYTYSSLDVGSSRQSIKEENIQMALQSPFVMVASDGGLNAKGRAIHPRAYANNARILATYVRDLGVLTLEDAVHKMTEMPAQHLGIPNRGLLKPGYKADIAVFRLEKISENATRSNPNINASGMSYVFVNGGMALFQGQVTEEKYGGPLYGPGTQY